MRAMKELEVHPSVSCYEKTIACFEQNQGVATIGELVGTAGSNACTILDKMRQEGFVKVISRCPTRYQLLGTPVKSVTPERSKKKSRKAEVETISAMEKHLKKWGVGA